MQRIVRAISPNDAIATLMKAEDLTYVSAAYAYPVNRKNSGPVPDDWRKHVRCSTSGKVYIMSGQTAVEL
jgi:hypothetical protein